MVYLKTSLRFLIFSFVCFYMLQITWSDEIKNVISNAESYYFSEDETIDIELKEDIKIGSQTRIINSNTGEIITWIRLSDDGQRLHGIIPIDTPYVGVHVFDLVDEQHLVSRYIITVLQRRRKRSTLDSDVSYVCSSTLPVSQATVIIDASYPDLTANQITVLKSSMSTYAGLLSSNVSVTQGQGIGFFTGLFNGSVITSGVGDTSGGFLQQTTLVNWFVSCGTLKAESNVIESIKKDVNDGKLSTLLGYTIIGWYVTTGYVGHDESVHFKINGTTTTADGLQVRYHLPTIFLIDVYILNYTIPKEAFYDDQDGHDLKLELLTKSDLKVGKYQWIDLLENEPRIVGYVTKEVFDNQPSGGYEYHLSATNSRGSVIHQELHITIDSAPPTAKHLIKLSYQSNDVIVYYTYSHAQIILLLFTNVMHVTGRPSREFVIDETSLSRVNGQSTFGVTFTLKSLTGSSCDVNEMVIFEKQLSFIAISTNSPLLPTDLFSISSYSTTSSTECSIAQNEKVIKGDFPTTLNVNSGKVFDVAISQTAFSMPAAASSSSVRLELRLGDGTPLTSEYDWISLSKSLLSENPSIVGVASPKQQSSFVFTLYGFGSTGSFEYHSFTLQMVNSGTLSSGYISRISQSTAFSMSTYDFTTTFISVISQYLSLDSSRILIEGMSSSDISGSYIEFTFDGIANVNPCGSSQLSDISNKMINGDGSINRQFESLLSASLNIETPSLSISLSASCDRPLIKRPIGSLRVVSGTIKHYEILPSYYSITSAIGAMKYEILNNADTKSRWVDLLGNTLIIIPYLDDVSIGSRNSFTLRVTSKSSGQYVDDLFFVTSIESAINSSYAFDGSLSISNTTLSRPILTDILLQKLITYFPTTNINTLRIHKFQLLSSGRKARVTWSNTSVGYFPCDVQAVVVIKRRLTTELGGDVPTEEIKQHLNPEMIPTSFREKGLGPCSDRGNTNPQTSLKYLLTDIKVKDCEPFYYEIPIDFAYDEDEGDVRNLRLNVTYSTASLGTLNHRSPISYDASKQTITIIPNDNLFSIMNSRNRITMETEVHDSFGGLVVVQAPRFLFESKMAGKHYNVTMNIQFLQNTPSYMTEKQDLIFNQLKTMIGGDFYKSIYTRELRMIANQNNRATFTISPCGMPIDQCNQQLISLFQSNIFDTSSINGLSSSLTANNQFIKIHSATESFSGPCGMQPPSVNIPSITLSVEFCGFVQYEIPENTFVDAEDGNARKLILSLVNREGNQITEPWIWFDADKQRINCLLTTEDSTLLSDTVILFKLIAKDKTLKTASSNVLIRIKGNYKPPGFNVILNATPLVPGLYRHTLLDLGLIVSSYLKTGVESFQATSEAQLINNGVYTLKFSNCTIGSNPCNVYNLDYMERNIGFGSTWQDSFITSLSTKFKDIELSSEYFGDCRVNNPPVVRELIGRLQTDPRSTYRYTILRNSFDDIEQGDAYNLNLQCIIPIVFTRGLFIKYNTALRRIDIIATVKGLSSTSLTVRATDIKGLSAQQTVSVSVQNRPLATSHHVIMIMRMSSFFTGNEVDRLSSIRISLLSYLRYSMTSLAIEFIQVTSTSGTVITINWRNSLLTGDQCDIAALAAFESKLISSGKTANELLVNALSSIGVITSIELVYDGNCEFVLTPPSVKPPPLLRMPSCGYLEYTIQENTFEDKIDGDASQLTLKFFDSRGLTIGEDEWVHFNPETRRLVAVLTDEMIKKGDISEREVFILTATSKRGLSSRTHVNISTALFVPTNFSFSITFSFTWQKENVEHHSVIFSNLLKNLDDYYYGNTTHSQQNNLRIIEIVTHQGSFYGVKITSCRISYDPCDFPAIRKINSATKNTYGLDEKLVNALQPDIRLISTSALSTGPCKQPNTQPTAGTPIGPIYAYVCTTFQYVIPKASFRDEEDGTSLTYTLTRINGVSITTTLSWMRIIQSRQLLGVVTYNTARQRKDNSFYELTIRATDTEGLWVESNTRLIIIGQTPQVFYSIVLGFTLRSGEFNTLSTQRFMVTVINSFYSSNITNIISYRATTTTLVLTWSPANLKNTCDGDEAKIFFRTIKVNDQLVDAFVRIFEPTYRLDNATLITAQQCNGPLNPPVPKFSTWDLLLNQCGGSTLVLPQDLFKDTEDGSTSNLKVVLTSSSGNQELPNWIHYDQSKQLISIAVSRDDAINHNSAQPLYTLTATDSSGLKAEMTLKIRFQTFERPKYTYVMNYEYRDPVVDSVLEVIEFSNLLTAFLNQQSTASFGLDSYQRDSSGRSTISFTNCSVSYTPCDVRKLNSIRDLLITSTSVATSKFQAAMPRFDIKYGYVQHETDCSGVISTPPVVNKPVVDFTISLCSDWTYVIPTGTFYDAEQGDTRNLLLSLESASRSLITLDSWVYLDASQQMLQAIATAEVIKTAAQSQFTLVATDNTQLSARDDFKLNLFGPWQVAIDCSISMDVTSSTSITQQSNLYLMKLSLEKISSFLEVSRSDLSVVDLIRLSNFRFRFIWSACGSTYIRTTQSETTLKSRIFVSNIVRKVFQSKSQTARAEFISSFGTSYTLANVKANFKGQCSNLPPAVTPSIDSLRIDMPFCGTESISVSADLFYDFEDGNTEDLDIEIANTDNEAVSITSWVNYNPYNYKITATPLSDQRKSPIQTTYQFNLKSTDSSGLTTSIPLTIRIASEQTLDNPLFNFLMHFNYHVEHEISYAELSGQLVLNISDYFSLDKNDVRMMSFQRHFSSTPSVSIEWTTCSSQSCNSLIYQKMRQTRQVNGNLIFDYTLAFQPTFTLTRWVFKSTICNVPPNNPVNPIVIPPLEIPICTDFTYKLPESLFVEVGVGDIRALELQLLSKENTLVSSSSWLQFEAASSQLFGIDSGAFESNQQFEIKAIGSSGKTMTTKFITTRAKEPYIANCPVTMEVERKYGDTNILDVYVLRKLKKLIESYYENSLGGIKIVSFQRTNEYKYELKWTSCSLTFRSEATMKRGLDTTDTSRLQTIFSRILSDDGSIKEEFKNHVKSSFTLESVTASYSCIESPPEKQYNSLTAYAPICSGLNYKVPEDAFEDMQDGNTRALTLSLRYENGNNLVPGEWLTLDEASQIVYGIPTNRTLMSTPALGYKYAIIATDKSGRSANVTFIVLIVTSTSLFSTEFIVGFNPLITETNDATYLWNITNALKVYTENENDQGIFTVNFNRRGSMSFYLCQLSCNEATVATMSSKFQRERYRSIPSDFFQSAMQPLLRATYVYVKDEQCSSRTTITIITVTIIIPGQPMCGLTMFTIPSTAFTDGNGRTSRDFYIQIRSDEGNIPQYVSFQSTTQTMSIIPVAYKMDSDVFRYQVIATHPVSGETASSTIEIKYPDLIKTKSSGVCSVTINWLVSLSPFLSDYYILKDFLNALSETFQTSTSYYTMLSYSRDVTKFPAPFSITFTACSLITSYTNGSRANYNNELISFLSKMFTKSQSTGLLSVPKSTLTEEFSSVFQFQSSNVNSSCSEVPPSPPRSNIPEPTIEVPNCGEFTYVIPEDLFVDDQDGNTRQLSLEMLTAENNPLPTDTWVIFDKEKQALNGLPGPLSFSRQPTEGYKYVIKATDSDKTSSTTIITLIMKGNDYFAAPLLILYIGTTTLSFQYPVSVYLDFTSKMTEFTGTTENRFYMDPVTMASGNVFSMAVGTCDVCTPKGTLSLLETIKKPGFLPFLRPDFKDDSVGELKNDDVDCSSSEFALAEGSRFSIFPKPCERFFLYLPTLLGPLITSPTYTLHFTPSTSNKITPVDSPVYFNRSSFAFIVHPLESMFTQSEQSTLDYTFSFSLTETQENIFNLNLTFNFTNADIQDGLIFTMKGVSRLSKDLSNGYFFELVWNTINKRTGMKNIQFLSLNRGEGSPFTFDLSFKLCNISNCTTTNYQEFQANLIGQQGDIFITDIDSDLPDALTISSIGDPCGNTTPTVKDEVLNITVDICGIFSYKLPDGFAGINENSRLIELKDNNGKELADDSWINIESGTRMVYAFPPEAIVKAVVEDGRLYQIHVTDNNGNIQVSKLRVFIEEDKSTFYRLAFTFYVTNTATQTDLSLQRKFVVSLAQFLNDPESNFRLLTFKQDSFNKIYYIKLGHCSIKRVECISTVQTLKSSSARLTSSSKQPSQEFQQSMDGLDVRTVTIEEMFEIDEAPILLTPLRDRTLKRCERICESIPNETFYDKEDGDTSKMMIDITDNQGNPYLSSYWINYQSKMVYAVPQARLPQNGRYTSKVRVTDQCGQQMMTDWMINLDENIHNTDDDYYKVETGFCVKDKTVSDANTLCQMLTAIENYIKPNLQQVKLLSYSNDSGCLKVIWTDCSGFNKNCNYPLQRMIKDKLLKSDGGVNPEFSNMIDSINATLSSIKEINSQECDPTETALPKARNTSIEFNVTLCTNISFLVPGNAFFDAQDGATRNLDLTLMMSDSTPIPTTSWLQFNKQDQIMFGYPRVPINNIGNMQREFRYILKAKDKNGNSAVLGVIVKILGEPDPNIAYEMQANVGSMDGLTDVEQEISLIKRIGEVYGDSSINNHGLTRASQFPYIVRFGWSFCKDQSKFCDCKKLNEVNAKSDELKLFLGNTEPIVSVDRVRTDLRGPCTALRGPQVVRDINELPMRPGKDYAREIPEETFSDEEDGKTSNLTLTLTRNDGESSDDVDWINLEKNDKRFKMCGLLSVDESRRMPKSRTETLLLNAKDSCGLMATDEVNTRVEEEVIESKQYVLMGFDNSYGDIRKNCSMGTEIIDKTAKVFRVPRSNIIVNNITDYNTTENTTSTSISVVSYHNCSNVSRLYLLQQLQDSNGNLKQDVIDQMGPQLKLNSASVKTDPSCALPSTSPIVDDDFPWWVLFLLLALAILFLLLWCCWLCIPRCCPGICGRFFPCCGGCCTGKYSSFETKSKVDEEATLEGGLSPIGPGAGVFKGEGDSLSDRDSYDAERKYISGVPPPPHFYESPSKRGGKHSTRTFSSEGGGSATDVIIAKPAVYPPVIPPGFDKRQGRRSESNDELQEGEDDVFWSNSFSKEGGNVIRSSVLDKGISGGSSGGERWTNDEYQFDDYLDERRMKMGASKDSSSKVVAYSYTDPRSNAYKYVDNTNTIGNGNVIKSRRFEKSIEGYNRSENRNDVFNRGLTTSNFSADNRLMRSSDGINRGRGYVRRSNAGYNRSSQDIQQIEYNDYSDNPIIYYSDGELSSSNRSYNDSYFTTQRSGGSYKRRSRSLNTRESGDRARRSYQDWSDDEDEVPIFLRQPANPARKDYIEARIADDFKRSSRSRSSRSGQQLKLKISRNSLASLLNSGKLKVKQSRGSRSADRFNAGSMRIKGSDYDSEAFRRGRFDHTGHNRSRSMVRINSGYDSDETSSMERNVRSVRSSKRSRSEDTREIRRGARNIKQGNVIKYYSRKYNGY